MFSVASSFYSLPFDGLVPPNPSIKEMKAVVVTQNIRPHIPVHWTTVPVSLQ